MKCHSTKCWTPLLFLVWFNSTTGLDPIGHFIVPLLFHQTPPPKFCERRYGSGGDNYKKILSKKLLHTLLVLVGISSSCSFYLLRCSCRLNFSRVHRLPVTTHWSCFPLSRLLFGAAIGHWWFSRKPSLVVCLSFVASLHKWVCSTEINATLKRIFQALKILYGLSVNLWT